MGAFCHLPRKQARNNQLDTNFAHKVVLELAEAAFDTNADAPPAVLRTMLELPEVAPGEEAEPVETPTPSCQAPLPVFAHAWNAALRAVLHDEGVLRELHLCWFRGMPKAVISAPQ